MNIDTTVAYTLFGAASACVATAFVSFARAAAIWWKLGRYLERHDPATLIWLLGTPEMGTYYAFRPVRLIRYLWTDRDDDATVVRGKRQIRRQVTIAITMWVTTGAILLALAIYATVRAGAIP